MLLIDAIIKRLRPKTTMTEDLMVSIRNALGLAPQDSSAPETIEAARLLASLQRTRIYSLDVMTTLFVDSQSKDLFEHDAEIAEIVPEGASLVIEYPYRPTLKAQKARHRISPQEEATLPVRMGILIQHVGKRVYAGLIVGHRSGPKPPPVMVDISELTCPRGAPFWNRPFTLRKLAISSFSGTESDQGVLNGLGQDLLEELAFALAFLVIAESPDTPLIKHAGHPSGFGPVLVEAPIAQARHRQKFGIGRQLDADARFSRIGWFERQQVDVTGQLASLQKFIEENLSEEAAAISDKPEAVQ